MAKHRIKKCESCNTEMKKMTGCMNCKEEGIMKAKVKTVMHEFKHGELHSHSQQGPQVTKRDQAIAIALSSGRKAVKKSKK